MKVHWYNSKNFGDALNQSLLERISGEKVEFVRHGTNEPHYLCVGSILQKANRYSSVWGAGMIAKDGLPKEAPKEIYAVRGPLTRSRLKEAGISCPDVYGDPALLIPKYYSKKREIKYSIGVVQHYIHKGHSWAQDLFSSSEIKLIDVEQPIDSFLEELLSCEKIISSSLHGLVVSDAYAIPNAWVDFRNRKFFSSSRIVGGKFKFLDYFMSVGRPDKKPYIVTQKAKLIPLLISMEGKWNIGEVDTDALLGACPFKIR